MKILVTGSAGFIGFHLAKELIKNKRNKVYGIDNINDYYDTKIKYERNKILKNNKNFFFKKIDILNSKKLNNYLKSIKPKIIIHLAAQAGVRYSIDNPETYLKNNINGFFNILEISRTLKVNHLVFASTSSVYGSNESFPLKETNNTDKPLSFYAATKKSNEVMAYSYSNIYKLPATGLRFFTVYGPFGRPDMSLYKFSQKIIHKKKIELFNHGKHVRDFTYIDDIISGIMKVIISPPLKKIPFEIYNLGNGKPRKLLEFLSYIEKYLTKKAKIQNKPLQQGDVIKTHADISKMKKKFKYNPRTDIDEGIRKFSKWILKRVT